jgi:hypothetical protein
MPEWIRRFAIKTNMGMASRPRLFSGLKVVVARVQSLCHFVIGNLLFLASQENSYSLEQE